MKGVSTDLLFLLLFALIFLGQYVIQRIRASKQRQQRTTEMLPEPAEPTPATQWEWELPSAPIAAPAVMPATITPAHRTARREVPATRVRRRFSRDSLFGDRRRLQDAVVIAAIVGPCRAVESHDIRQ